MTKRWTPALMKKPIDLFLRKNGFLPITGWNVFDMTHTTTLPTTIKKKQVKQFIISKVASAQVSMPTWTDSGDFCTLGRPKSSQTESSAITMRHSTKVDDTNKAAAWPRFFATHAGDLKVFWVEVHGDREQRIIEEMIECSVGTEFDKEYPRGSRRLVNRKRRDNTML